MELIAQRSFTANGKPYRPGDPLPAEAEGWPTIKALIGQGRVSVKGLPAQAAELPRPEKVRAEPLPEDPAVLLREVELAEGRSAEARRLGKAPVPRDVHFAEEGRKVLERLREALPKEQAGEGPSLAAGEGQAAEGGTALLDPAALQEAALADAEEGAVEVDPPAPPTERPPAPGVKKRKK